LESILLADIGEQREPPVGNRVIARPQWKAASNSPRLSLSPEVSRAGEANGMNIELTDHTTHTSAVFQGPLDEAAKAGFDEQLHPLVEQGNCRLLIDLSGVPKVTSAGIGHLVTLVARSNTKGGRIVLAAPTPFVRSIFHTTQLTKFFDIADSAEAAASRLLDAAAE
jgi:anti-sigma B factor antagonist